MAYVTASTPRLSGFSLGRYVRNLMVEANTARARRDTYNRVFSELSTMTDRELADINLSRLSIRDIAMAAAENIR
jgi:uncharacterized protein YjiS (DUF1127 family)